MQLGVKTMPDTIHSLYRDLFCPSLCFGDSVFTEEIQSRTMKDGTKRTFTLLRQPVMAWASTQPTVNSLDMSAQPDHQSLESDHRTDVKHKVPRRFAEGDYWRRYFESAQEYDKETLKRLGSDMDILLIFAGLFSGINTAFIAVTLNLLSPGPNDETNMLLRVIARGQNSSSLSADDLSPPSFTAPADAVRINAFFIASLSCSMLAAFGAVLGKQWIAHAESSAQGGSLRVQAQQRQRKFSAAERWHFQSTVEMLPVALQLALLSFWMGLTDFLWSLHHTVAHVALGFAILGAVFYFYTVVASAIDPDCPFQTPVTTIFLPRLRQLLIVPQAIGIIVLYILVYASFFVTYWITNILVLLTSPIWLPIVWAKRHALGEMVKQYSPILLAKFQLWGSSIVPWVAQYWYNWKQVGSGVATIPRETSNEVTEVESVAWLLTTSTDEKALVEAANNIITLRSPKMVRRLTFPSIPYAQLLIQLRERLVRIQLHLDGTSHSDDAAISEDARAAVVYSRAVLHVVLPSWLPPEFSLGPWGDKYAQDALAAMRSLTPGDEPSPLDEVLLFKLIWSPLEDVDPFLKIIRWVNPAVLPLYLAASLERLKTITVDDPKFGWTIVEQDRWKNARALVTAELAASCIAEAPCETTALNMVSFSLFAVITSLRLVWDIGVSSHRTARWLAYTSDRDLVPNLSGALAVYPIYVVFSNTTGRTDLSRLPFREIYIRLLNQLRNRFMESDKRMKYHTINLRLWWSRLLGAMQAILSPIDQSHKDVLAISNDAELEHEATVRREVILLMQLFLELVVGIDAVAHPGEASASLEADSRPSAIALWQLASSPRDVKHPDPLAALLNLISFASFANREHHLGLFRSYPPSITTFTNALAHPSPDVRTAALRTMSTFATEWFDHQEADIHDFFTDADLAKALARCARHELSPPISNRQVTAPLLAVVQNLITWPGWRRALPRAFFTELESVDTDDETLHVTLTALWMEVWYLSSQPVSEPTTNKGDTLDSEDLFPDGYVPRATHLVRFMNTSESGGDMLSNTGLVAALRAYATRVKEQRPDGGTAFLAEYEQLERTVDTSPPTNGIDPMADTPGPSSNAS